jgi:hypothetical protein
MIDGIATKVIENDVSNASKTLIIENLIPAKLNNFE